MLTWIQLNKAFINSELVSQLSKFAFICFQDITTEFMIYMRCFQISITSVF